MNHGQIKKCRHRSGGLDSRACRVSAFKGLRSTFAARIQTPARPQGSAFVQRKGKRRPNRYMVGNEGAWMEKRRNPTGGDQRTNRRKVVGDDAARWPAQVFSLRIDLMADGLRFHKDGCFAWLLPDLRLDEWKSQRPGTTIRNRLRDMASVEDRETIVKIKFPAPATGSIQSKFGRIAPATGLQGAPKTLYCTRHGSNQSALPGFCTSATGHLLKKCHLQEGERG